MEWSKFRTGSVGIAGIKTYQTPAWHELDIIFDSELEDILDTQ